MHINCFGLSVVAVAGRGGGGDQKVRERHCRDAMAVECGDSEMEISAEMLWQ